MYPGFWFGGSYKNASQICLSYELGEISRGLNPLDTTQRQGLCLKHNIGDKLGPYSGTDERIYLEEATNLNKTAKIHCKDLKALVRGVWN